MWTFTEQFSRGLDDESRVGRINKAVAMWHLRKQVKDPELRAKLTPDYPIGCKRILFSNEFYPALAQDNVDVVTHAVTSVTPKGVVDSEGIEHEVDAIIYATGFDSQDFLQSIDITGTRGQKLATQWADGAHAYLGMYVPNFPNLFVTYGPNTNLGGGSIIFMLEAQARHMRQALDRLTAGDYTTVEVTEEAEMAYDRRAHREARALRVGALRQLVSPPLGPHHLQLARRDTAVRQGDQGARADRVPLGMTELTRAASRGTCTACVRRCVAAAAVGVWRCREPALSRRRPGPSRSSAGRSCAPRSSSMRSPAR